MQQASLKDMIAPMAPHAQDLPVPAPRRRARSAILPSRRGPKAPGSAPEHPPAGHRARSTGTEASLPGTSDKQARPPAIRFPPHSHPRHAADAATRRSACAPRRAASGQAADPVPAPSQARREGSHQPRTPPSHSASRTPRRLPCRPSGWPRWRRSPATRSGRLRPAGVAPPARRIRRTTGESSRARDCSVSRMANSMSARPNCFGPSRSSADKAR